MQQDIERFVGELSGAVWEQVVGLPLEPTESVPAPGEQTVEGHVHIVGAWTGTLVLQCSASAAKRAAEAFFQTPAAEQTPQDAEDAVGELTNMIGGNLKSLVAEQGCALSLPTVIAGRDFSVRMPRTRTVTRQTFLADHAAVVVTVLEPAA